MVTLSGERITITTLHTFFRVACKSSQVYVSSEMERLISRKAAAVLHDAQHQAAPFTVAGPVRWELPVGRQCRKAARQAANGAGGVAGGPQEQQKSSCSRSRPVAKLERLWEEKGFYRDSLNLFCLKSH